MGIVRGYIGLSRGDVISPKLGGSLGVLQGVPRGDLFFFFFSKVRVEGIVTGLGFGD